MFDGYDQALTRLESAVRGTDPAPAFIALFEALNWAVALDDRAGEHWAPEGKTLGFGWRDRLQDAYRMRPRRVLLELLLGAGLLNPFQASVLLKPEDHTTGAVSGENEDLAQRQFRGVVRAPDGPRLRADVGQLL
jgi:hypothetical protein